MRGIFRTSLTGFQRAGQRDRRADRRSEKRCRRQDLGTLLPASSGRPSSYAVARGRESRVHGAHWRLAAVSCELTRSPVDDAQSPNQERPDAPLRARFSGNMRRRARAYYASRDPLRVHLQLRRRKSGVQPRAPQCRRRDQCSRNGAGASSCAASARAHRCAIAASPM